MERVHDLYDAATLDFYSRTSKVFIAVMMVRLSLAFAGPNNLSYNIGDVQFFHRKYFRS